MLKCTSLNNLKKFLKKKYSNEQIEYIEKTGLLVDFDWIKSKIDIIKKHEKKYNSCKINIDKFSCSEDTKNEFLFLLDKNGYKTHIELNFLWIPKVVLTF